MTPGHEFHDRQIMLLEQPDGVALALVHESLCTSVLDGENKATCEYID